MTRKWQLLIITGLTLRLVFFLIIRPWNAEVEDKKILTSDPAGYQSLALSIKKSGFTDSPFVFRTPGYPLFIYFVYFFSGPKPWVVILIHFLVAIVSAWLLYQITLLYFPEKAAYFSAFFFLLDPHINLFNQTLFSETLFIALLLGSVFLFLRWLKIFHLKDLIISAITLGLATLVRLVTFYYPIFLLLIIMLFLKKEKWKYLTLYSSVFLLSLSPWMLRNYLRYDHYSLSTIQGYNLLFCNVTFSEAVREGKDPRKVEEAFRKEALQQGIDDKFGNPFANAEYYQRVALQRIANHPGFYVERFFNSFLFSYLNLNIFEFCHYLNLPYTQHSWSLYRNPPVHTILPDYFNGKTTVEIIMSLLLILWLLFSYLMALAGIVFLARDKKIFIIAFIIITIFYFALMAGDVGEVRYKLPAVPFYLMLSGYGVWRWWLTKEFNLQK